MAFTSRQSLGADSRVSFTSPLNGSAKKRKSNGNTSASHSRQASESSGSGSPIRGDHAHDRSSSSQEGSKSAAAAAAAAAADAKARRIKTARACDGCRQRKIRCDVIDDGSPPNGDPNNGNGGLTCAHCRQYGFNCTFFLPITETRFKKKREREAEEAAAARATATQQSVQGPGVASQGPPFGSHHPGMMGMPMGNFSNNASHLHSGMGPSPTNQAVYGPGANRMSLPHQNHQAVISASQEWPPVQSQPSHFPQTGWNPMDNSRYSPPSHVAASGHRQQRSIGDGISSRAASISGSREQLDRLPPPASTSLASPVDASGAGQPPDARVLGPTSLAYIVHSTAFVPGGAIEAHDIKHSQTFEVGASGDGIIKLNRSRRRAASSASASEDEGQPQIPDSIRGRLAGDVAEKLINSYFEKIGHLFPVITKSEFLRLNQPPALLFYSICSIAALDRNVPREVLAAVRIGLTALFRDSDILSNSSATTVRSLLILSLHGDVHGSSSVQSGSKLWNRLGAGLRMAQDLGLHRDASGRDDVDEHTHFLEQKRRIWGACVTSDRLVSIALGHPLSIDLTDCDVRLPSPFEICQLPTDLPALPGTDRPFAFNTEMLKLSILFGRVQKDIYGPTGLMTATDDRIVGLLNDIDQWRENLPEELQFTGPQSSAAAGILHLCFACIQMLFFRVFMRISYSCPTHLKFSLTITRMSELIRWSRESIDWVGASGAFYLDTMQFVSYALVFCATVQYHACVRRGDDVGLQALVKLKDIVYRGRAPQSQSSDMSLQAKTAEIIGLLHDAARGRWANTPSTGNLNPTAGVVNRRTTDSVKGIRWRNAPGRPGGGVFEAADASLMLADLPSGTIILGANRTPALVRTAAHGWQPVPGAITESMPGNTGGVNGMSGGNNHIGNGDSSGTMASSSNDDSNLPDLSNFTYLGGSVWQDESGRPVDRRGSGLMIVLPQEGSPGTNGMQDSQATPTNGNQQQQQQVMNVNPRLNSLSFGGSGDNVLHGLGPFGMVGGLGGVDATGASNNNGGLGPSGSTMEDLTNLSDPLMLNDPLMGMLDWQAWQSYLNPGGIVSSNGLGSQGGQGQ